MVFTFFKEWAFLGFKASSFTHQASPQTVLKVSARVEKSVPLYRGDNEFSILAVGNFTFKAVSPQKNTTLRGDDFADIAPHRCNHQPKKHDSLYGAWRTTH